MGDMGNCRSLGMIMSSKDGRHGDCRCSVKIMTHKDGEHGAASVSGNECHQTLTVPMPVVCAWLITGWELCIGCVCVARPVVHHGSLSLACFNILSWLGSCVMSGSFVYCVRALCTM